MKRIVSLLLVAAMLCSLAACSNEQAPTTGDTQGAADTSNYNYDPSNLESMLTFFTTTGETACTDTETEAEALIGILGETYDSYDANKAEVLAFFENMQIRSADLYAAFQAYSIDYFKCVAKQDLDDYDMPWATSTMRGTTPWAITTMLGTKLTAMSTICVMT